VDPDRRLLPRASAVVEEGGLCPGRRSLVDAPQAPVDAAEIRCQAVGGGGSMAVMLEAADVTRRPPTRTAPPTWLVVALACAGQFLVVLDVSVVNVALPSMRADLGLDAQGLQWVVNGYAIAFAGFMLLGGRAGDLYGRKRMFLVGLALFTLASLGGGPPSRAPNCSSHGPRRGSVPPSSRPRRSRSSRPPSRRAPRGRGP
jgi:hypothetical protein